MKTTNLMITSMKKSVKYICALLLLAGVNVSAWGTTCTLYGGVGGNTVHTTIDASSGTLPNTAPEVSGWTFTGCWCESKYSSSSPTTTYPSGSYIHWYNSTPGGHTTLYAVYQRTCTSIYYSGAPYICYNMSLSPTTGDSYASASKYCNIAPGETITITAYPETGKSVSAWTVFDGAAEVITPTSTTATTFTFNMPNSDVDAEVSFVCPSLTKPVMNEANSITSTGATLSWGAVSNAVKYSLTVYDDDLNDTEYSNITGTSKVVTGLEPNTHYNAYVYAYNSCDEYSEASLDIEFTTLQRYAISYNNNGGSGSKASEYKDHGISFTLPSTAGDMTNSGYHIIGWLLGSSSGTHYDLGGSYTANEAATFYVEWAPNDYTISFNANGGSGSMDAVEKANGETYDLPACGFTAPSGKVFDHWAEGSAGGTSRAVGYTHTVTANITFYAVWRDATYNAYVFSCAELTLTEKLVTAGAPIFITSAASKTVRSQDSILIAGSGLTPSTTLTFPGLPAKFEIKSRTYTSLGTDASGAIDAVAYIFYTPADVDTEDGLDEIAGITVSVGGAKPKTVNLTQSIIGRHLPADFVIAGKKDGKWWALPSNMANTTNPKPSEIAVNDFNNPSIAYTATSNIYGLEGPTTGSGASNNTATGNGQYIRLTMSIADGSGTAGPAPLFGSVTGTRTLGKSGTAKATSDLSAGWWWQLKQTNTSITNPQDAKYTIYCANNTNSLSLRDNAGNPDWGLFASGVEELRLIPASDIVFTEAYFVEWGQHGGVIEVDATGIDATSVVAHLGEATSLAITLSQTGTSGGKSSKYNYTVNFGDGIDFAASTSNGAMLTLEWKNGETVKAISNIVVPKIIASSATMKSIMSGDAQWETEVHVLPDVTLTANAGDFESNDVMIKQLEIYPGATVVVTKGAAGSGTLKVKTLVLRNGWTCASGTRKYDVARLYITPSTASLAKNALGDVWYMDWYIDYDQYYPIAVPWKVAVNSSNIVHRYTSNTATFGPSGSIRLRYYDGEQRATSGQSMIGQNWKDYGKSGNENLPDYLEPSKGYSFSAKRPSGKAFSIVRMTLGIPLNDWTALGEQGEVSGTHKDQVSVTGWGKGTADWYAMGWNFIGNPYMCTFNGDDGGIGGQLELQNGGSIKYATIPDVDFKNYDQVVIAEANLKPASGFFVQANDAKAQTITFNASKIVPPSAPARYTAEPTAIPEQEAYIRLSYEGGKDQMGLIIGEDYTEAYEVNADLAKVLGDAGFVKTYMQYGGMDMAYVAINQELAKAWIPVTVILPKDGEYTFSLMSSSEVEQLEGVYLIDYAENETVTNLIDKDYTFVADAATISNRFAINAIIGERQTPTDIDVINEGGDLNSDRPFKFLYRDKVYIYHCGVIYDATGKRVREINK